MGQAEQLKTLLAPLGVYRWEGTFQWGELQSQGMALDQAAEYLEETLQEQNLATAQGEGLEAILALLGRQAGEEDTPAELRAQAAALLRVRPGCFTVAALNDTLRSCGLPARVEETGQTGRVKVVFPETTGIPAGFSRIQDQVEALLPCHLQIQYQFGETT